MKSRVGQSLKKLNTNYVISLISHTFKNFKKETFNFMRYNTMNMKCFGKLSNIDRQDLSPCSRHVNVKSTHHLHVDEIGQNHSHVDATSKQVSGINILKKTFIV